MNSKVLLTIPVAIAAALAIPGIAAAHNANVAPSCRGIGWNVWNYEKELVNSITVTVDGTIVWQDLDFKASDTGSYLWAPTVDHTWSVVVNAPGTQWDRNFSGTQMACETAPTTTVPTSTTVVATTEVPPTTSAPATTVVTDTTLNTTPATLNPTTTALTDVFTQEPELPATGGGDTVLIAACILFAAGIVLLVVRGRRVP